jgi:hypothetical protein
MESSRKRLVGLLTTFFLAAAVLCSTMSAARRATASEMRDRYSRSAAPEPLNADASSACAFQPVYGLLSKQPDIQITFLFSNSLPKIDFPGFYLSTTSQPQPGCYKPKEKIYLFNSVLTSDFSFAPRSYSDRFQNF